MRWPALLPLLLALLAPAPAFAWRQVIAGTAPDGDDDVNAIAVDGSGNVVAVGQTESVGAPFLEWFVAKFAGGDGTELWRRVFGLTAAEFELESARAVALDASGAVIVAGTLGSIGDHRFSVRKLDGASGADVWGYDNAADGGARAVAVDGGGNVIAGGALDSGHLVVVKLASASGAVLWTYQVPSGGVSSVAVDSTGDVLVAGGVDFDFFVAKVSGVSGTEIWARSIDGSFVGDFEADVATSLAVDGAGDVVAAGRLVNEPVASSFSNPDFFVVKLAGADGAEVWRVVVDGADGSFEPERASAVAVGATGDVIVGGEVWVPGAEQNMTVMRLAGATGAELWRRSVTGGGNDSADRLSSLVIDGGGDVVAGGALAEVNKDVFTVVKIAGVDGSELWREQIAGSFPYAGAINEALSVRMLPTGDVIAGGYLQNAEPTGYDVAVFRLGAVDGAPGPLGGKKLLVKDLAGNVAARRLHGIVSDRSLALMAAGSAGDPTLHGATLTLTNPITLESATFSLPAGPSWTALGTPPGSRGYRYRDSTAACRSVIIKSGMVRALCVGSQGPFPFDLDEPTQGSLILSLQLGTASVQCAQFGGSVRKDTGTANPGPSGVFLARNALPFSGSCP